MESASGICWKRNGVCFLALLQLTKPRFQCLFDEPGGGNTLPVSCSFRFPVELFVDMQDGCHTGSLAFARFLSRAYLAGLQQLIQERFNRPGEFGGLVVVHHVAGIRPERIGKLVLAEGFGLPPTQAEKAPERYAKWLEENREPSTLRPYASFDEVAERLK